MNSILFSINLKEFPWRILLKYLIFSLSISLLHFFLDDVLISNEKVNFDYKKINENLIVYSFLIIIIFPVIEELAFRLPLKHNSLLWLSGSIILVYIVLLEHSFFKIVLIFYLSILILHKFKRSKFWTMLVTMISILSFTLIHLSNYNSLNEIKVYELIYILIPQGVVGILATRIRLLYNTLCSIIYHTAYNGFIVLITVNCWKC